MRFRIRPPTDEDAAEMDGTKKQLRPILIRSRGSANAEATADDVGYWKLFTIVSPQPNKERVGTGGASPWNNQNKQVDGDRKDERIHKTDRLTESFM